MIKIAILAALLWCLPSLGWATISTPIQIATATTAQSSGTAISTTADAPIHSLIVVVLENTTNNATISNVKDSANNCSNAYSSAISQGNASTPTVSIFYCLNTSADLPSAGTITATTSSGNFKLYAFYVSSTNGGADQTNSSLNTSTSTTSFSLVTSTLGKSYELVVGGFGPASSAVTTWTEGSGFSTLQSPVSTAFGISYQIVDSSAAVTWAPSWTTGHAYAAAIATFKSSPNFMPLPYVIP